VENALLNLSTLRFLPPRALPLNKILSFANGSLEKNRKTALKYLRKRLEKSIKRESGYLKIFLRRERSCPEIRLSKIWFLL
jgi:hypothetical protein